jgi:uncharacterized membrane protein YesL
MGFFKRNYSKPGPGIEKDEPKKKGIQLFIRIMSEDGWDLMKMNFLFFISMITSFSFFLLWLFDMLNTLALVISLITALPVGGAIVACFFCITKILRDEPGYFWNDFKRKFKENCKQAAIPGIVYMAFIYAQILQIALVGMGIISINIIYVVIFVIVTLLFGMITPYIFLQIAYINIKTSKILKNSIFLPFANIGKSFRGAVSSGVIYIIFLLFFPTSLVFIPFPIFMILYGFSLPWLFCLMFIWPIVNNRFAIEETIQKQRETNQ